VQYVRGYVNVNDLDVYQYTHVCEICACAKRVCRWFWIYGVRIHASEYTCKHIREFVLSLTTNDQSTF